MIDLRYIIRFERTRVAVTAPDGSPLYGGGVREVTKEVKTLQARVWNFQENKWSKWEDVREEYETDEDLK